MIALRLAATLAAAASLPAAPGAPGKPGTWTDGNKQGIGTSISTASRVWFALGDGVLQEVYYPTIDRANVRSLELAITDGRSFLELESRDTEHRVEPAEDDALLWRQVNTSRSGRYRVVKEYAADPQRDALLVRARIEPLKPGPLRAFVVFDPSLHNSALHDTGYSRGAALLAADATEASALAARPAFVRTTSGYRGTSDGLSDLETLYDLRGTYRRAADGDVVQVGELPAGARSFELALGFGPDADRALQAASASLAKGFLRARREYRAGWSEYLASLKDVDPRFRAQYRVSAMVLRAHEDKTARGAGAASLTIPWGRSADASEPTAGGYHLVWARDLYHVATAFHAMGDKESADRALEYLFSVQQKPDGSFPQNSWLDGTPYWGSLQLDEVAYPILLAHELGRTDAAAYRKHLKPAAEFIAARGPATPQERWEEESGYSPSTIAAEIAALVCAADAARRNDDRAAERRWLALADAWTRDIESWTVAKKGPHGKGYFLRIAGRGRPDKGDRIELNNGAGTFDEREIVDAGFLELVRLGIRRPDDPVVRSSLEVVDKVLRVETPRGPAWYRYNHDGYGEKADGRGYDGTGIGRLWPLLTGERGEYALAAGQDAAPYLSAMQAMAGEGRMLPEQVWDRADSPDSARLRFGEPTGSAAPLAWTNAQFVRLAIALQEGRLPETPQPVADRYLRGAR